MIGAMEASQQTRTGWPALFSGESRATAIIIAVGIALHSANIYVATAVMPSVAGDVVGLELYAWATTVFVFAAVLGSTAAAGAAIGGAIANLAGFTDPGGVPGTQDAARWLYIAMLAAPLLALVAVRSHSRSQAAPEPRSAIA
jgi:hypothetical protein